MDKNLIERYKEEMLKMYSAVAKSADANVPKIITQNDEKGYLLGIATEIRGLYFVPDAKVTVFTGTPDNMNIIDTSYTDQTGKTKEFSLPAPNITLSETPQESALPYSLYNMMFEAEGYLTNVHLNIPVFPSVTSRQTSNLLLLETAGKDKSPRIFDESQKYNL